MEALEAHHLGDWLVDAPLPRSGGGELRDEVLSEFVSLFYGTYGSGCE
ncbi:MAG: hypothetical protein HY319_25220 [Armatimonadetes bacterium]|nr:hypothetical protein [Armatimonadota bacterium]